MNLTAGTLDNPIIVKSAGDEQFAGCTGYPADSHWTVWLGVRLPYPFPYPSNPTSHDPTNPHPPHRSLEIQPSTQPQRSHGQAC